jgi:hypothetical protein
VAKNKTGTRKSFEDAMLEYARCMRSHGVDMPDPTFTDDGAGHHGMAMQSGPAGSKNGPAPDSTAFKAAEKACKPIMTRAEQNMPRPSAAEIAKMRDQSLKFARCMRAHGIDMPDPTFDENGGAKIEVHGGSSGDGPDSAGTNSGGGPPKMDPKFEAANKACEKDSPMKMSTGSKS